MNDKYDVYIILRHKTGDIKRLENIFKCENVTMAKCYFGAYIEDEENKNELNLYKLGTWSKEIFKPKMTYIINGYLMDYKTPKQEIEQIKINYQKASEEKTNKEIIKALFGGKEIEG